MTPKILDTPDVAALSDDALIAYIADLTDLIESAPVGREARLLGWDEARRRVPPIPFSRLAAASRMTTSGIINGQRAKTEKDHLAGLHRKPNPDCHPCRARSAS